MSGRAEGNSASSTRAESLMALERRHGARNYAPMPVVLERGEGVWLWDVDGRKYLDMMSAYSAVSLGHGHPRVLAAARRQLDRLCVTSRAYYTDALGPLTREVTALSGLDAMLPMNTVGAMMPTTRTCRTVPTIMSSGNGSPSWRAASRALVTSSAGSRGCALRRAMRSRAMS